MYVRFVIYFLLVALCCQSCTDDSMPEITLKGKLKTIISFGDDSTRALNLNFYYSSETGKLETIAEGDSTYLFVQIHSIGYQTVYLEYSPTNVFEVSLNGEWVNNIEPLSSASSYLSIWDWQMVYNDQQSLDSIKIDMHYSAGFNFPWLNPYYENGLLFNFQFGNNYTSSFYSFTKDNCEVMDTFNFSYHADLPYNFQIPFQFPYFKFAPLILNFGHEPFNHYLEPAYVLRMCGYKIFKDNRNLIQSAENVIYDYVYNSDNQLAVMQLRNTDRNDPSYIKYYYFIYYQ